MLEHLGLVEAFERPAGPGQAFEADAGGAGELVEPGSSSRRQQPTTPRPNTVTE